MTSSDDPPMTPGGVPGRRWSIWVFLTLLVSPVLIWVLLTRNPPPPPPLSPGWTRLTTERDGLLVDLPAEPKTNGPVEKPNGGSETFWYCVFDGYQYGVNRRVIGFFPAAPDPKPDDVLIGFCDGLKQGLHPDKPSFQDVTVAGRPGREMRHRGQKAASVMRIVQIDRTLYFFVVGAPTPDASLDGPDVVHFLNSVRFSR